MCAGREAETGAETLCVLMVEDDERVIMAVREGFARRGIRLLAAQTLAAGRRLLAQPERFDVLVLDLNLPDGNGADLANECRRSGCEVPIIMVTARDTIAERVAGLSRGADDYVCKPFAVDELIARLQAVLRRVRPQGSHLLSYADVQVDLVRRQVRRGEIELSLSARELDLLAYLMCHPEQVLEKNRILRDVWGDEADQDANVLHVYANYLRNKLEQGRYPRLLHTVRGVGYVFSREEPDLLAVASGHC
ncbi:MAG TPA: response regulator transcription factor [Phycisphaerae bacterium]|nr:response regulator transcription factor [Phycisphaerales bacterium]HRX87048.1 response regulator transcription factor [Phycisphaerae bacterium]